MHSGLYFMKTKNSMWILYEFRNPMMYQLEEKLTATDFL